MQNLSHPDPQLVFALLAPLAGAGEFRASGQTPGLPLLSPSILAGPLSN